MRQIISVIALLALTSCIAPAGIRYLDLPTPAEGALHVVNFDVGQADATLITYKGKTILFDCGSPNHAPEIAGQRIPRRLDALLGHRHIDYFVITHYHQDHLGNPGRRKNSMRSNPAGIFSLIDREGVTIGTIIDRGAWVVGKPNATYGHYFRAVKRWIKEGKVGQRRVARPGDTIDLGGQLKVDVIVASSNGVIDRLASLYPAFFKKNPPTENDYSVGLKLTLGDFELFGAGDLGGENIVRRFGPVSSSYNDIESYISKDVGGVEVYRVNHHGSGHSSNACFTEVMQPSVSVVSSGHNNPYKHPAADVYQRLKKYSDVFITGGVAEKTRDAIPSITEDVVGGDVEILVSPDGSTFWVNAKRYQSRSEAEEEASATRSKVCTDTRLNQFKEDNFKYIKGRVGD
ncbi:MAG: MBL fold metallo-hydrolase [Deltaproteobacteria bacterium]|jgi:beta-lactamase superfamily II metal-dependent hydrolase|nr:MBL fold metallo-hydrolase [Deltaproteobacteria bacterium]